MNKKFIAGVVAVTAMLAIAVPALADDDRGEHMKEAHKLGSTLEVHINDNGSVLVRGAKVTAVSGNTLTATTVWGSTVLTWTVNTDSGTNFVRKSNGASSMSEISVNDFVSFQGNLITTGSGLVVNARVLKDWSVQKINATLNGSVQSVGSNSFVLANDERGNITVNVTSTTSIMKGDVAGVFADITVGASVQVKGIWDMQTNTLAAERVIVRVVKPTAQVFEGTIKSITSTVAPTTMVVTMGGVDYTVNIAANISVLNNLWLTSNLANFHVGDHVRLYGTISGTTITASVIRDTSINI